VLMGLFALLGATLAAIGVYGVLNHAVVRRTREIGIHMALGATTARVAEMVLRRGAALVVPGVACGLLLALATTRVLANLLYGVSATDPLTFVAGGLFFLLIATTACLLPSRRAAQIDPTVALRAE
jgi:ABC-type antimicrobial peptide transport system permease subunit